MQGWVVRTAAQESGGLGSGPGAAGQSLICRDRGLAWDGGRGPAPVLTSRSREAGTELCLIALLKVTSFAKNIQHLFAKRCYIFVLFLLLCTSAGTVQRPKLPKQNESVKF